jgi:hypothetical protein
MAAVKVPVPCSAVNKPKKKLTQRPYPEKRKTFCSVMVRVSQVPSGFEKNIR